MSKHSALNTFGRSGNPAFTRNFDNTGTWDVILESNSTGSFYRTDIFNLLIKH